MALSTRCICTKTKIGATVIPDPINVHCPEHGFPEDIWYAGHPLRRHALSVDTETGEHLTYDQKLARRRAGEPWDRFRLERPSETYARLLAEAS